MLPPRACVDGVARVAALAGAHSRTYGAVRVAPAVLPQIVETSG